MKKLILNHQELVYKIYDFFIMEIINNEKNKTNYKSSRLFERLDVEESKIIEDNDLESVLFLAFIDHYNLLVNSKKSSQNIADLLRLNSNAYIITLMGKLESKIDISVKADCLSENRRINKTQNKKTLTKERISNIELIYDVFIDFVVTVDDNNESSFNILKKLLNSHKYINVTNNKLMKDYYQIFKEINYFVLYTASDYLTIRKRLIENIKKFKGELVIYYNLFDLNKLIRNIDSSYDGYDLNKFLSIYDVKLLRFKTPLSFYDLKKLQPIEVYKLFRCSDNYNNIKKIFNLMSKDINTLYIEELRSTLTRQLSDNALDILQKRSQGLTLREIGIKYKVTRERIRQIEARSKKKIIPDIVKLDKHLKVMAESTDILQSNEINQLKECMNLIIFLHPKYIKDIDAISLMDNDQEINKAIKIFKNENPYILIDELDGFLESLRINHSFSLTINTLKYIFLISYKKNGIYYFNKKVSLAERYKIVLINHFNDFEGISSSTISSFKQRYYEIFDDKSVFKSSDRAVLARAIDNENIVLSDKGVYTYKDPLYEKISEELYSKMMNFIIKEHTIYIEAIFHKFHKHLSGFVNNRFELHGLLKRKYPELFFSKDFVSINPNPIIDIEIILKKYIKINNGRINSEKFIQDNPKLKGLNAQQYFNELNYLLPIFNKEYMDKNYIVISSEEIDIIKKSINELLSVQPIISSAQVLNIIQDKAYNLINRLNINSNLFAYHLTRNFFDSNYYYDYPNISIREIHNKSKSFYNSNKYVIDKVIGYDRIKIRNIIQYAKEVNIRISNIREYLEYFYENGFLRFNENEIASKNKVLTPGAYNMVNKIESQLLPLFKINKIIKLSSINLTELPKHIKWNIHLLAHLLINLGKHIEVETIGNQYNNLDYEIRRKNV